MGLYQGEKLLSSIGKSPAAYAKDSGYTGTDDEFYSALASMPGHLDDQSNPHNVTASQVGADAAGSAASALSNAKAYTDQSVSNAIPGTATKDAPTDADSLFLYDAADSNKPKKTLISKVTDLFKNTFYTKTESDLLLSTKPGQNLLDNSVFLNGCLVDQRGGYVVPPGVDYYVGGGGDKMGTTTSYVPVTKWDGPWPYITVDGEDYVVAQEAAVRGYTGAGYGPDRWLSHEASNTTLIYDDHITITRQHAQKIDNYAKLVGKQVTISALTNLGLFTATGVCTNQNGVQFAYNDGNGHDIVLYNNGSYHGFQINNTKGGTLDLYGAKLELGDTQTLAHQDTNGNWVLNELPDYGEQLARCQRYYVPVGKGNLGMIVAGVNHGNIKASIFEIPVPVTMRANPVIADVEQYGSCLIDGTWYPVTDLKVDCMHSGSVRVYWPSNGVTTIAPCCIDGAKFAFSADL